MARKQSHIVAIEIRKRELVEESERNRLELFREVEVLQNDIVRLKRQVRKAGSIASSAALLATAVTYVRRQFKPAPMEDTSNHHHSKASWIGAALDGAQMGASLFMKIKSLMR